MAYKNCFDAMSEATARGKTCVGYDKPNGWILYSPIQGCSKNIEPEFLCLGTGILPIPLSDSGFTILKQWFNSGCKPYFSG